MKSEMQITAAVNPTPFPRMTNKRKWKIPCAGTGVEQLECLRARLWRHQDTMRKRLSWFSYLNVW